eukprot:scaffold15017_cov89-Isochrysis_galbana.AAC.2
MGDPDAQLRLGGEIARRPHLTATADGRGCERATPGDEVSPVRHVASLSSRPAMGSVHAPPATAASGRWPSKCRCEIGLSTGSGDAAICNTRGRSAAPSWLNIARGRPSSAAALL